MRWGAMSILGSLTLLSLLSLMLCSASCTGSKKGLVNIPDVVAEEQQPAQREVISAQLEAVIAEIKKASPSAGEIPRIRDPRARRARTCRSSPARIGATTR